MDTQHPRRDGVQAVANATRALELTEWKFTDWLPILAAAHAETGNFDEAMRWQTRFLEAAPEAAKAEAQSRLELYRSGQPLRELGRNPRS
jgi:serine/threonine-protein kinase